MEVSINTEVMRHMASLSQMIYEEMENCNSVLKLLQDHNDWNCKERDQVCERIEQSKQNGMSLMESCDEIADTFRNISMLLDDLDIRIPDEYSWLDTLMGETVSMGVQTSETNGSSTMRPLCDDIKGQISASDSWTAYGIAMSGKDIQICNYADIADL